MDGKPAERSHAEAHADAAPAEPRERSLEHDLLDLTPEARAHVCEEDKPQWPPHDTPVPATAAAPGEAMPAASASAASTIPAEELELLTTEIIIALKTVYDPEIPADIYELGLIYKIDIDDSRFVTVEMTLTAPGCPVAGEMPIWVENAVSAVPGVSGAKVALTFDPPWTQDRMSDEARLVLNMF